MPPLFFREWPAAKRTPSRREATVRTPPTIAQVDVRKCANDCRPSEWTTNMGEISKLKNAPKQINEYGLQRRRMVQINIPGTPWTPCWREMP